MVTEQVGQRIVPQLSLAALTLAFSRRERGNLLLDQPGTDVPEGKLTGGGKTAAGPLPPSTASTPTRTLPYQGRRAIY